MPALQAFCIQAAVAIFFNYIFQITAFVVALIFDCERRKSRRMDVFCCVGGGNDPVPKNFWKNRFGGGYNKALKTKACGGVVLAISLILLGLSVAGIFLVPVGLN